MPKPFSHWTVLPHGELTPIDDKILTVTGRLKMPLGSFERRMTIVRLVDGRLVVYSAIALREAEMKRIEDFGVPSYLIVPGERHRMDVRIWKRRYPAMKVIVPPGARDKVTALAAVDATSVDFGDPSVRFVTVPGTRESEGALEVEGPLGTTLILNELIFNLPKSPGIGGWFMKALGMTGDPPRIPSSSRILDVDDREALRAQLERWAHLPGLRRVIVSHGRVIDDKPGEVLERAAGSLAA